MADLFSDGFESGDLSAWDSAVTDSGDLSAHADAAIHGSYGLKCLFDDTTAIYVRDDTPSAETRYRARIYIDTTALTMPNNGELVIVKPYMTAGSARVCQIGIKYYTSGTQYKVYAGIRTDAPATSFTAEYSITNGEHYIEIDWKAATSAGANNGYIELLIDGVSKETKGSIDNDTYVIDWVLVGSANDPTSGTEGYLSIDSFASNNDGGVIGAVINTYELSRTDGIEIGDTRSETMAADILRTDGLSAGSSTNENSDMPIIRTDGIAFTELISAVAELLKTDGVSIGDSKTISMAAELLKAEGIVLSDTRVLDFTETLIYELLRTDGMKIADSRALLFVIAEAVKTTYLRLGLHRTLRR